MISPHDGSYSHSIAALEELQARPQWVCWRKETRRGKPTKVPFNPRTGALARANDPRTWGSYQEAKAAWGRQPQRYDGVGYMFCRDVTGIDFDHCVHADGTIDAWAQRWIARLASYAEYSPSGTGVHILVRGTIPRGMRRCLPGAPRLGAAIEMYCERRYFTITGRHVEDTPLTIEERPEQLAALYAELTAQSQPPQAEGQRHSPAAGTDEFTDEALVKKAMAATNGTTFRTLWNGDSSGYVSPSEADQALCRLLAFWTGKNASRMDRLFRRSGLYRAGKWDRSARSGESYGQGTIARAIAGCHETYAPGGTPSHRKIIPLHTWHTATEEEEDDLVHLPELDAALVQLALDCLEAEEEGDARLYAHLFRGRCVYDHTEGAWYEWRGHFWERDDCKHALLLASGPLASVYLQVSAHLSQKAAQAEQHLDPNALLKGTERDPEQERYQWLKSKTSALIGRAKALKKLQRAQNVLTYAQALLKTTGKQWDRHVWLLACTNGVLDLRTGELHPGRPEDYIRTVTPTDWTGIQTPAPRWEQFLTEVFEDREPVQRTELIAFLQRMLGYGITGDVSEHVFLMLYGEEGRNGKDTMQHLLSSVLGEMSSAISKDVLLESGRFRSAGSATPHIRDLHGKRLAWASESEKGARFSVGQVKEYSGGGDIPARGLYEKHITKVKPTHLLILLTNHKPYADAEEKAFWDRLRLITFNMRFVDAPAAANERQKDTKLWHTLEGETSGILAWLVRGCLEWQRQGLSTPQAVLLDGEQYRREQDIVDLFLSECCVLQDQATVAASMLFEAYVAWGKANNLRNLLTGTSFGKKISKRFPKIHTKKGAAYQGIGLLSVEMIPPEGDGCDGLVTGSQPNPSPIPTGSTSPTRTIETMPGDGLTGPLRNFPKMKQDALSQGTSCTNPSTRHQPSLATPLAPPVENTQDGDGLRFKPVTNPSHPSPGEQPVEVEEGVRLLVAVRQKEARLTKLLWRVPGSGFEQGYLPREEYFRRLEVCLESRDPARRQAAIDEMRARGVH
jgi:putative DNA primase/helicase